MDNIILEGEYGSRAHGTHTVDSDRDVMGVFVEPKEYVTGILTMDTQEKKSAVRGQRSTALDTDGVYYPLRKWAALAAKGNPTVLTLLFLPDWTATISGEVLRESRDMFLSKQVGERFLGYMISQRNALLGTRNKKTNRPELNEKYGWDVKFGYHMLRLGIQGIEMMNTGKIQLPMAYENKTALALVRSGDVTKEDGLDWSFELEDLLRRSIQFSKLPADPDVAGINKMLHNIYQYEWSNSEH